MIKSLILCIDGLGWKNLSLLPLPNLRKLISQSNSVTPTYLNVLERGWPAMYTGLHVSETGCYYQIPVLDKGKVIVSNRTGLSFIPSHLHHSLIWNKLNSMNYKVGVFCIPTCSQAQNIDGFFISATGAGIVDATLSEKNVFPPALGKILGRINGDLGCRMGYRSFIPNDIDDLALFVAKHIDAVFLTLKKSIESIEVDVLFFGIRLISEISYKFIGLYSPGIVLNEWQSRLKEKIDTLLEDFDNQLLDFIKSFAPSFVCIVSDHGIQNFADEININEYLCYCGMIERANEELKDKIFPTYSLLSRLWGTKKPKARSPQYLFDSASAFSVGFTDAIYTAVDRPQLNSLMTSINDWLNVIPINCKLVNFQLSDNYRRDIWHPKFRLILPNGAMNTARITIPYHQRNSLPTQDMFKYGFYGEHSGGKTTDAVFAINSHNIELDNLNFPFQSIYSLLLNVHSGK